MTTHTIPTQADTRNPGHFTSPAIIMIEGTTRGGGAGHTVGGWDATTAARIVNGGEKVQGPHAYTFRNSSVIASDRRATTGGIHDAAREKGLLFETKVGDTLIIDGVPYTITLDYYGHAGLAAAAE